jgi:hypothetical protein
MSRKPILHPVYQFDNHTYGFDMLSRLSFISYATNYLLKNIKMQFFLKLTLLYLI